MIIYIGNHELDHVEGDDPSGEEPFNPAWWNSGSHASSGECGVPTYVRWGSAVPDNKYGKYSAFYIAVEISGLIKLCFPHSFRCIQITLSDFMSVCAAICVSVHRCIPLYDFQFLQLYHKM